MERNRFRALSTVCAAAATAGIALLPTTAARAQIPLATNGTARCVIVRQADATEAECYAANELAATLHDITGATFLIVETLPGAKTAAILVGPGAAASAEFLAVSLATFHGEELIEQAKGNRLLLAGGRPRGTLYAINRFLQDQCGVRWWAPWATDIPHRPTLRLAKGLNFRSEPAFEYREPYWFPAFPGDHFAFVRR